MNSDKKIAKLEQEYQELMAAGPQNVARLAEIIRELGKLWNSKIRDEESGLPAANDEAGNNGTRSIDELQEAVTLITQQGKTKMAKARSPKEIHKAFTEGLNQVRCLLDE